MTVHANLLRQIHRDARPHVEQLIELKATFSKFQKLAAAHGLDWGLIKALLKAEIEDELDGKNRVGRIIAKTEFTGECAILLGLAPEKMNENICFVEAGTGEIIEPAQRSVAQGDVIAPAPGAGGDTITAKGDDISLADLRDMLDYSPETGEFRWKVAKGRMQPGDTTGSDNGNGYLIIWIDGQRYRAHRLAWLYHYGQWPVADIDHVNGDPADNRIENLRECTDRENSRNRGPWKRNQSGLKGVHAQNGKWRAQITADGEKIDLGTFSSKEEAHAAYCEAARKYHGDFARTAASSINSNAPHGVASEEGPDAVGPISVASSSQLHSAAGAAEQGLGAAPTSVPGPDLSQSVALALPVVTDAPVEQSPTDFRDNAPGAPIPRPADEWADLDIPARFDRREKAA